jgi:phosphopantothenoylcysteine decarboxylase/phosphopantothenate--cysteine ligase
MHNQAVDTPVAIKKLVLGITGGIAAYKAAELVRLLVKQSIEVQVVMTEAAHRFITPVTMQALSGKRVYSDMWDACIPNGMPHIELSREADVILVAPASADFIAKLVHGNADDLLSTLCLARDCPLLVAPAMNRQMWEHPATQRNIAQLLADGVTVFGPEIGDQACGETGLGRMSEPDQLLAMLEAFQQPKLLQGKRILLTAGPTVEAIDPVRAISNFSSGKMGYAIARAAQEMGAEVTLVSGPTRLAPPTGVAMVNVSTAEQMLEAVMRCIASQDIFISVAAVADYKPASPSTQKIKKSEQSLTLELQRTVDILSAVSNLPEPPYCVGFAAESEQLLEHAEAKRKRKHLPLLVANLVQESMGLDEAGVTLLDDDGRHVLARALKIEIARKLLQHIADGLQKPSRKAT